MRHPILASGCLGLGSTVLVLGGFLAAPPPVWAQRLPTDMTSKELTDQHDKQRNAWQGLLNGSQAASDADKPVADVMAKWFTARLTWLEPPKPGDMEKLVREFDEQVLRPALQNKENNQAFLKLLNQQLIEQFRKVLGNDSVPVRINGARIMALTGRLGQDELGDYLVEVLGDANQNEGVKYYALQGIAELFTATRVKPEDREKKCIQAVLDYLAAKSAVTTAMPPEAADGIRFARRQAVRALAQSRLPAVDKDKGNTALALLREVARDASVSPSPSPSEQLEAAIGIGQLQSSLAAGYQPDYAAYFIGQFVVDFATRYEGDRQSPIKAEPWKVEAARLHLALDAMKSDTATNNAVGKDYVGGVVDKCTGILKIIEDGTQTADVTALRTYLDTPHPSTTLFQANEKAVVNPGPPAGG